jgi:hypothetical protein
MVRPPERRCQATVACVGAQLLDRSRKAVERSIWLPGKMSPRARREFEALGWKVNEDARQGV